MSKIYELTDLGLQLANKTSYPDNPNFAVLHALKKCHRLSSKGLVDATGLGKGEISVAIATCVREGAVSDIGEVFG